MAAESGRRSFWNRPFLALLLACLAVGAAVGSSQAQTTRVGAPPTDGITASRFSLEVDGQEIATFAELSRLTTEVEPVEYLESGSGGVVFKQLPGKAKPPTITLKRGMSHSLELWAWHEAVRQGNFAAARKGVRLVMYDTARKQVASFWLEQAWPSKLETAGVKLEMAGTKAGAVQGLMETLTLTSEQIQRIPVDPVGPPR